MRTQPPRRRCSACRRSRRGPLMSSQPPLRASGLQLMRRAVAGAPCRRRRPFRSALLPAADGWPSGQDQSRRHGAGGRRNSGSGVQGADSRASGSQGLQHHPPLSGGGDGDGDDHCVLPAPHMQHHFHSRLSYKEALLRQCGSGCQGGRRISLTAEVAQVHGPRVGEEGWQAVKIKRPRSSTAPQPDNEARQQEERHSLYLRKMKGLCFNCLARDHKVAACCYPMKCWQCRRYGHISTYCTSRRSEPPPSCLEDDSALQHTSTDAGSFVDDSLLQFSHSSSSAACDNSFDPMVIEVHLMMHMQDSGDGSSTLQAATPSPVANHLSCEERLKHNQPTVDIVGTPLIVRCQEEQLIGHELFKALSKLKNTSVTPLSHAIRRNTTPEKKSIVVHQESNMHSSRHRKLQNRTLKPGFKMVRNMLTKKWLSLEKSRRTSSGLP